MNNVKREKELYGPMSIWLKQKLTDKYRKESCVIIVEDSSEVTLDSVLQKYDVIQHHPQVVGLNIQIDVIGIVKFAEKSELVFIEAKKTPLNLHDLGQLWAYCKLCNPVEAYLLSSHSLGSLSKVLLNLKREDMLDFGDGKKIKKMQVGVWDLTRKTVDNNTLIPKI